jgi:hypothetical protein
MSIGQKTRKRPQKPDEAYHDCAPAQPRRRIRVAKRRVTFGGAIVEEKVALIRLQEEMNRLKDQVAVLQRLIDPADVAAFHRLKLITPSEEEFAEMARGGDGGSPPTFVDEPGDRP